MGKKKSSRSKPSTKGPKSPSKRSLTSSQTKSVTSSRGVAGRREGKRLRKTEGPDPAAITVPSGQTNNETFPIVGIGASAGGLEAFSVFLKALRPDTGMAFVLVQHMDPTHESLLNQLLAKQTEMPVIQVKDGIAVEPNCVYVIPPNRNMTIRDGRLRLVARQAGTTPHTPIDTFLCALAEDQQRRAIGVILSGIGSDGTKGLQSIKAEGGVTFAQDESSAKYSGMPVNAAATGCVDLVLSPDKIAAELGRMIFHPYLKVARSPVPLELPSGKDANVLKIFRLLRFATGVDFTYYKQTTIRRRIARRMLVRRCETLAQYGKYLDEHPDEIKALFQDVLIHVTAFFREPEVLQTAQKISFPRIIAGLAPGEPVRIWVPGCSSGEEVYSIAIALYESLGQTAEQRGIQIFGTDISDSNIQKARAAFYPQSSTAGLSAKRLNRFFVKMGGGYQVSKSIRDLCVFARHDLTKDPPFSRMDLISCRNVLIYLEPRLQRKVLYFIHYALKPNGILILGKSEGVSAADNLFALENRKANIYSKLQATTRPLPELRVTEQEKTAAVPPLAHQPAPLSELRKTVDRIILDQYAPSGLIVDSRLRIIHFQGDTSAFLRPASGEPSFDLLKLVRPELMLEIRAAIQEAKKLDTPARREGIPFKRNGKVHRTNLEIAPIEFPSGNGMVYLVLFQNRYPGIEEKPSAASAQKSAKRSEMDERERLRRQVASLQEQLRSLMEDHESATEELRAANEETLSSNEELQSTNEELQTAKEELQSTNEELTTLNDELQNRNLELSQTAVDLNSLLTAVEMPIVILGKDRCIRRFTPMGEKLLNLIPSDVGRPISQIRTNIEIPDLDQLASEVLARGSSVEREVRDKKGHWYALRVRAYQTAEDKIEGIVIVLVDIHDIKQYATAIVETMRGSLLVLDCHFHVLLANPGFYKIFKARRKETENRLLWEVQNGEWNIPQLRELLEQDLPKKKNVVDYELEHDFPSIGRKTMLLNAHQLYRTEIGSPKILLVIEDITERKIWEEQLQSSESCVRALLESAAQAILAVGPQGRMAIVNTTAEQMFGYTRAELLDQPVEMLIPARLRDAHRQHRVEYFAHPRNRPMGIGLDLSGRRKDGSEFPVEVSLSYIDLPDAPLAVAFVSDITARKAAEENSRQLSARLLTTTEDERKRIARELHDSFGSGLATFNLRISGVEHQLSSRPDLAGKLEEIRYGISDIAKAASELSHSLHPAAVSQLGLKTALEAECARHSQEQGLKVKFSAENIVERMPDTVALCLYRVAQESLKNIRKHARAKKASLTLTEKGGEIVMVIRDFGKGFDLSAARAGRGLGLVSMEERVRLVKGTLSVTSKPGKGTKVEVHVPLEN